MALIVTRADGTSAVLPCSLPLTGMLRSKEVTLAQCLAFPVIEFTHRDTGAVINMLVQPTREYGEAAVLKVDDVKVIPEFKPEAVNFESLIALGV
ncbi:MAG: hypothetical protein H5T96_09500 [Tissierellales bacterium]|nr:hypothetical protein [Tissierellales bacterium]